MADWPSKTFFRAFFYFGVEEMEMTKSEARRLVKRLGVDQIRIAAYANVNSRFVCEFLQGKRVPPRMRSRIEKTLHELRALAAMYGPLPLDLNNTERVRRLLAEAPEFPSRRPGLGKRPEMAVRRK